MEGREDACYDCFVAQGVLRHVRAITALHEAAERDRAAMRTARDEVLAGNQGGDPTGRFAPRCRRSRKLDLLCETLETGGERVLVDFLKELDELANAKEASSF